MKPTAFSTHKRTSCWLLVLIISVLFIVSCSVSRLSSTPSRPVLTDSEQSIENLRTFTKLYGYIRFFHPTDEASKIDWDAFAVYGASRVKNARSTEALLTVLNELFAPMAPSVQILLEEQKRSIVPELSPQDTRRMKVVAWQHKGWVRRFIPGHPYRSKRTNRALPLAKWQFGYFSQAISAASIRGARIRFSCQIQTDVNRKNEGAALVLFAKRDDVIIADAWGTKNSVNGRTWQQRSIELLVPKTADTIELRGYISMRGTAWFDDCRAEVIHQNGDGSSLPITNLGFESDDLRWIANDGFLLDRVPHQPVEGKSVLRLSPNPLGMTKELFENHPQPHEFVLKNIGSGLKAMIPLALWSNTEGTLPKPSRPLEPLIAALGSTQVSDPTKPDVRFGAVIIAWSILQHFYPYFDVVEVDWDQVLAEILTLAMPPQDADEFENTLYKLAHRLQDGHAHAYRKEEKKNLGVIPAYFELIEDQLIATASDDPQIKYGDFLVSIDGKSARKVFDKRVGLYSGTLRFRRWMASKYLGSAQQGSKVILELRRENETVTVTVERGAKKRLRWFKRKDIAQLEDGIWYINLDRVSWSQIKKNLSEIASAPGVVIEIEEYPNGNAEILNHLLKVEDHKKVYFTPQRIYPDNESIVSWIGSSWNLVPKEPHIKGKVVFISTNRAVSFAESILGYVEGYKLGEIVGEATAGANGNLTEIPLPGGYWFWFTGMRVLKLDGSQHHLVGVQPTVPMKRTQAAIREGRDEYLEKALEIIRASMKM